MSDVFYIHYGRGTDGPFQTVAREIRTAHDGRRWVYFDDHTELAALVADGWDLQTSRWDMSDDNDNCATLESMEATTQKV